MTMQTVQWRTALRTGDTAFCRGHIVTLVERVTPNDWKVSGGNLPGVWTAQGHELQPVPGKAYAANEGRDPRLCYPDGKPVKVGDLVRVNVTGHKAGSEACEVETVYGFGQIGLKQRTATHTHTYTLSGSMLEFVGRKSEGELPPADDGAQPLPDVDADLEPVTEFRPVLKSTPVKDETFARSREERPALWKMQTPPRDVSVEELQAAEAALAEARKKKEAAEPHRHSMLDVIDQISAEVAAEEAAEAQQHVVASSNAEIVGSRGRVLEDQAFDAKTITQSVQGALVSRAVVEYRIITTAGPITIRRAGDLRWNEDESRPEVYVAGAWVPVPDIGIVTMAAEEHLHWRRPDGTVLRWDAEAPPYSEEPESEPEPEREDRDPDDGTLPAFVDGEYGDEYIRSREIPHYEDQPETEPEPEHVEAAEAAPVVVASEPPAREEEVTTGPVSVLALDQIRVDGGTQARAGVNWETVNDYAELMAEGVEFPPVTVYFDGAEYWLADGFHRYHAAKQLALAELTADILKGDSRAARLHAASANATHGLPRTNDDKRRAVLLLLNDPAWAQWSDREIARRCVVGHPLVAKVRASLTGSEFQSPTERTGADGRTINVAGISAANAERKKTEPVNGTGEIASDIGAHLLASGYRYDAEQNAYIPTPESMARAAQDAQARQVDRATGEIVALVDPVTADETQPELASAPEWLTATVLVNDGGLLCGVVLKVGSQQFNAFYLPRPDRPWDQFATHQQAVEFLESKVR